MRGLVTSSWNITDGLDYSALQLKIQVVTIHLQRKLLFVLLVQAPVSVRLVIDVPVLSIDSHVNITTSCLPLIRPRGAAFELGGFTFMPYVLEMGGKCEFETIFSQTRNNEDN